MYEKLFGNRDVKIDCTAADFVITNGAPGSRLFALDIDDAVIGMGGNVNLRDVTMNLTIDSQMASPPRLATPRFSRVAEGLPPLPASNRRKQQMQRSPRFRRRGSAPVAAACLIAAAAMLSGCNSLYSEGATAGAGITGAALASKVTSNAAVATGIGLGAVAGARAGVQYTQRVAHAYAQDQIAHAAGPLDVGSVASWSVSHTIPIEGNEHGRVTVSRIISGGTLDCKEIVFSVDVNAKHGGAAQSAFYVASICRDGNAWKWASAEPATGRWGALQ
jgi:hypothetical protein